MLRSFFMSVSVLALVGCNLLVDKRLQDVSELDSGGDASTEQDGSDPIDSSGSREAAADDGGAEGAPANPAASADDDAGSSDAAVQDGSSPTAPRDSGEVDETPEDAAVADAGRPVSTSRKDIQACAGLNHGCLLQPSGALQCFGSNRQAANAPRGTFTHVACGELHACALHAESGHLECWGDNGGGQVTQQARRFVAVAAGQAHTCALEKGGKVSCWGADGEGQSTPPDTAFADIAAGHDFTCGIRAEDRGAECWGNDDGLRTRPPAELRFASLSLSEDYGCGLTEDGYLHCWGHQNVADHDNIPADNAATNGVLVCSIFEETVTCAERQTAPFGGLWFYEDTLREGSWALLFGGYRTLCGVPTTGPVVCTTMGPGTSQLIDQGTTIRLPPGE